MYNYVCTCSFIWFRKTNPLPKWISSLWETGIWGILLYPQKTVAHKESPAIQSRQGMFNNFQTKTRYDIVEPYTSTLLQMLQFDWPLYSLSSFKLFFATFLCLISDSLLKQLDYSLLTCNTSQLISDSPASTITP